MEKTIVVNKETHIKTGVPGFDDLLRQGIPKGSSILVAGGAGSGKTNFCLQLLAHHAAMGKKCYYMSFGESKEKLVQHMERFGWNPQKLIDSGNLKIKQFLTSEIYYYNKKSDSNIEAMMTRDVDSLRMDLEPLAIVEDIGFKPDFIVFDSLTSVSSTFKGKEQSYRFYIEQLFRFFEKIGSTNFLINETNQVPDRYAIPGVEEFLADGIVVFYNIRRENGRENAIEILKMRDEKHQKKIYSMTIDDQGITVYPKKEITDILCD
jgi:circadian clock protein KaiC